MYNCMHCNKEIPPPMFKDGGRQNGKSTMLLYYNIRQMCCSDKCFERTIKRIKERLYGQD